MHRRVVFLNLLCLLSLGVYAQQTVGLFTRTSASRDGYILFAPTGSTTTYLVDKCGKLVHNWPNSHRPGLSAYLLPDGTMLRTGSTTNNVFTSGGSGGVIEKIDWNGNVMWTYTISSNSECQHHDVCPLPNGNILAIVWELKTNAEALAAGRNPAKLGTTLWSEKVVELEPVGTNAANIIWEWRAWDHLIQEFDNAKANYGVVSQHPELINLNYAPGQPTGSDWLHMNSIAYNSDLDQIIVSLHNTNEIWVVDHSTTTAEASSHSGGAQNKGGDLIYRWGNPIAYNSGSASDQKLYGQHNAHWIPNGLPHSGKIMIFNNGMGRPGGNYSSVEIIAPPVTSTGGYNLAIGQSYQPDSAIWKYVAPNPADFYAMNISGAQRLANGNTLICDGPAGKFFEIDSAENIVWEYTNPVNSNGAISQGSPAVQNLVFRCTHYDIGYSGLSGHGLIPGNPIETNPLSYNCFMNTNLGIETATKHIQNIRALNPFHEQITITSGGAIGETRIALYSITGVRCAEWTRNITTGEHVELTLNTELQGGLYILEVSNDKQTERVKLLCTR